MADKKILDKADRVNWRKCNETIDEEKEISNTIRNEFKPYDISRQWVVGCLNQIKTCLPLYVSVAISLYSLIIKHFV